MTTTPTSARKALEQARDMLGDCELNWSNFDVAGDYPGTVEYLNNCAIQAWQIIDQALANLTPEPAAGEVTQADRDAAAAYLAAIVPTMPELSERVRENQTALSRAFRDHRLASSPSEPVAGEVECQLSPDGRHQVDTSMESGPNNCFHCEQPMRKGRSC